MSREELALRDAVQDAFLAYWRGADTDAANELWRCYCAAQAEYDAYLIDTLAEAGLAAL